MSKINLFRTEISIAAEVDKLSWLSTDGKIYTYDFPGRIIGQNDSIYLNDPPPNTKRIYVVGTCDNPRFCIQPCKYFLVCFEIPDDMILKNISEYRCI